MKRTILSGVLTSVLCASSVLASGTYMSKDKLGDFLIAPMYMAKGNVCTELKVFNTNETNSILAKVSIREQIKSQEVDLPIFLSPGDVWYGEICNNDGKIILTSDDDSNHPAIEKDLKKGRNLAAISNKAGYSNVDFSLGYVEVYPIAQFEENSTDKVFKNILVDRWNKLANGDTSNPKLRKNGVDGYSLSGLTTYKNYKVKDFISEETSKIPMVAFKGAHDKQLSGKVISFSEESSANSLLGETSTKQILKLLQNDKTSFTYNNSGKNQFISLTFPFSYKASQLRTFEITVRDNEENKNIVIFSPAPIREVENEVALISVEKLIQSTENPEKFVSGMIQIKELTNKDNVQLGMGTKASYIPMSFDFITTNANCCDNETNVILNSTYIPSN